MLPNYDNSTALPSDPEIAPVPFGRTAKPLAAAPIDLNVEIPDLLPQGIAVEAKHIRRPDLVAARRRQRGGQERHFDLLEDTMVEARRRHTVGEAREMRRQIG